MSDCSVATPIGDRVHKPVQVIASGDGALRLGKADLLAGSAERTNLLAVDTRP